MPQDPEFMPDPEFVPDTLEDKAQAPLATFPISGSPPAQMFGQQYPTLGRAAELGTSLLEGMTSPLSLGLMATTGGGSLAAAGGFPKIGTQLIRAGRVLSVPGLIHGGNQMYQGNIAGGAPEVAMSILGLSAPTPRPSNFTPEPIVAPRFGMKGSGPSMMPEQGQLFEHAPGDRLYLENTEPDYIKALVRRGYGQGGVDNGRVYMVKLDKPLEPPPIEGAPAPSLMHEIYNAPRGLMSIDFPFVTSAAFRQGLPLVGTKAWFEGWGKAAQAYGSRRLYDSQMAKIEAKPLFKDGVDVEFSQSAGEFKVTRVPSVAQQAGLRMTGLKSFQTREENLSGWLEKLADTKIPLLNLYGKHIRGSNQAYTAFLNHARAETFENMVNSLGIQNDLTKMKEVAEFINNATGRGTMRIPIINRNLEQNAKLLSDTMFSPRNFFARTNLIEEGAKAAFNPKTYADMGATMKSVINAEKYALTPKTVRQAYLLAGLRVASFWGSMAAMAKMAGAEVNTDVTSADFGKIKIGDTRFDPAGGFQPFITLAGKIAMGQQTSTTTGKTRALGEGYRPATTGSVAQEFMANKLHPTLKLAYDVIFGSDARPVFLGDRLMQMTLPMFVSDLYELQEQNPDLMLLAGILSNVGFGSGTYDKESMKKPTFQLPTDIRITQPNYKGFDIVSQDDIRRGR